MKRLHLRLPATSANLGSGFDALALALELSLEIEAAEATEFSIAAEGRNADLCGRLEDNLLFDVYKTILRGQRSPAPSLAVTMRNQIPLGMGCGSSAAVRLAGVALAAHFGSLGWKPEKIVQEAARLEGHPDNVAGCWFGGLTIAAEENGVLSALSIAPPKSWGALLVFPETPVATTKARSVLPKHYSRQDAVANIQSVALLTASFAQGRADLLRLGTRDRLHQPYREQLCPLLPILLPMQEEEGVLSVTLSGAGPSVLLITDRKDRASIVKSIQMRSREAGPIEIVDAGIATGGALIEAFRVNAGR